MKLREYDLLTRMMRTRSLTVASVFYAIGCIFAYLLHIQLWYSAAMFAALLIAVLPKTRFRCVFIFLCITALGAANFSWQWNSIPAIESRPNAELSGRLCSAPSQNSAGDRLILELTELTLDGKPMEGKLRLYLRNEDDNEALFSVVPDIGQLITISDAHIWKASGATNPGQFNYANYLRLNGIIGYATGKLEDTRYTDRVSNIGNLIPRIRLSISNKIEQLFPTRSDIAKAFLIGDRSQISDEDKNAFSLAGVAHLLAISGMHISMLSYVIMQLLNLRFSRKASFVVTLTFLFLYGLLLGFPASMFRAFTMFTIAGLAPITGQRYDPLTSLSFSMLLYLLLRPIQIISTGFALSYGATAGIILLSQPITAALCGKKALSNHDIAKRRSVLYQLSNRILRMLIITLSAQIAILPIVIFSYGAQSVLSLITGLIAIPIAMLAYLFALPAVLLSSSVFGVFSDTLFGFLTSIARVASSLPGANVRIARFPAVLCIACFAMCVLASPLSKLELKIRRFIPLFIIPAILVANLCSWISTLGTSVLFTDSGQSDCAIIRTCGKVYLVDTGDSGSAAYDYLSMINRNVDGVFITHPHTDHIGGLSKILTFCVPNKIFITDNWDLYSVEESALQILQNCSAAGSEIITVSAGDRFELSKEASIEVLSPVAGFQPDSANDDSLVLQLTCGESSVLFTGDSTGVSIENAVRDSDILKVPHHGSSSSLTENLLENVSPSACIVSVGYNTYGHPTEDALTLIEQSGALLYRTDLNGAIDCKLSKDGSISISPYLKQEETHEPS